MKEETVDNRMSDKEMVPVSKNPWELWTKALKAQDKQMLVNVMSENSSILTQLNPLCLIGGAMSGPIVSAMIMASPSITELIIDTMDERGLPWWEEEAAKSSFLFHILHRKWLDTEKLRILLRGLDHPKLDKSLTDQNGMSLIERAVSQKCYGVVKTLISRIGKEALLENHQGVSLLRWSIIHRDPEMIQVLWPYCDHRYVRIHHDEVRVTDPRTEEYDQHIVGGVKVLNTIQVLMLADQEKQEITTTIQSSMVNREEPVLTPKSHRI